MYVCFDNKKVVRALAAYQDTKDWSTALLRVLPPRHVSKARKENGGAKPSKKRKHLKTEDTGGDDDEEEEEDDDEEEDEEEDVEEDV
jgi:hypothetical protein